MQHPYRFIGCPDGRPALYHKIIVTSPPERFRYKEYNISSIWSPRPPKLRLNSLERMITQALSYNRRENRLLLPFHKPP